MVISCLTAKCPHFSAQMSASIACTLAGISMSVPVLFGRHKMFANYVQILPLQTAIVGIMANPLPIQNCQPCFSHLSVFTEVFQISMIILEKTRIGFQYTIYVKFFYIDQFFFSQFVPNLPTVCQFASVSQYRVQIEY